MPITQPRPILLADGPDAAIEHLRTSTNSGHGDFDFIVALHRPEPELRRIWAGMTSSSLDQTAIGDTRIREEVDRRLDHGTGRAIRDYQSAFIAAFTDKKVHLGTGVGGFPITLFAKPEGHAYRGHYFGHSWKPIVPVWGTTTYEDENDLLTGEWSYRHDVVTTKEPGIAVLAIEVPQAKTGFVYAPLLEDDPQPIKLLASDEPYTQHQEAIHKAMGQALDAKIEEHKAQCPPSTKTDSSNTQTGNSVLKENET